MTIVNNIIARADYPFECLEVEPLLQIVEAHLPETKSAKSLFQYLECFLQITDQKLSLRCIASPASNELIATFCGAMASQKFSALKRASIGPTIRRIREIVNVIRFLHNSSRFTAFGLNRRIDLSSLDGLRKNFEILELNEEKVWYWSGWPCINGAGRTVNLALAPIYYSFGRNFTQRLFDVCETFLASRRYTGLAFIRVFSRYTSMHPNAFRERDLSTSLGATRFFSELWKFHYTFSVEKSLYHEPTIAIWRNEILPLIKQHLIPSGLFANPNRLPEPEPVESRGKNKNLRERSGQIVKSNLLVDVPLHIPDEEAFRLIKQRIIFAHSLTIAWCDNVIQKVRTANDQLKALASDGLPILTGTRLHEKSNAWLASDQNPDQIKNLAATLKTYGYDELRKVLKSYGVLQPAVAERLGISTTEILIPFCLKLISLDPRITPSYLKSVEIFDKNGRWRGVNSGDTIDYLHGHKDRRGAEKSEIRIRLTPEAESIVKLIITITEPLRESLRNAKDERWRKLLLTSQQAVGVPCDFGCKAKTDDVRAGKLLAEIVELSPELLEWDSKDLWQFAKAILCPSRMRATSGVVHFFKTGSLTSMAKTLGHVNYDPKLLGTYLPTSILHYFRDRWVRVFQAGVIVQAMKSSDYLLEATGFASPLELAEFLENHVLPNLDKAGSAEPIESGVTSRVLISLSISSARILLALYEHREDQAISPIAAHWSTFSSHLLSYIQSDEENNLEALEVFRLAEELGPLDNIESVLRG